MTRKRRIFVQIPSYRDPQLIPTLADLAQQASVPCDVRVVVCWQHADDETLGAFTASGFLLSSTRWIESRAVHFLEFNGVQIELIDIPYWETKGAGWARNSAQQRFRGEKYNLQIDAHHRFVEEWDVKMAEMLEALRDASAKPLLTGYPPAFCPASYPDQRQEYASAMLFHKFTSAGIVRFRAVMLPDDGTFKAPLRARFMSGGFVFSDGHFVDVVRQDPEHFFFTEEIVMAARAHTHGYDFFHPHVPLLWHDYASSAPEVWEDLTEELKQSGAIAASADDMAHASACRAQSLLGIESTESGLEDPCYGLGSHRSLHHYERFAGLSFSRRAVHRSATVLSEPDAAPTLLSEEQWKCELICRRTLQILVSFKTDAEIKVHSVQIVMRNEHGLETPIKCLTQDEIATLAERSVLEVMHTFSSAPTDLPLDLLLQSETSHGDAERFFSIAARELLA